MCEKKQIGIAVEGVPTRCEAEVRWPYRPMPNDKCKYTSGYICGNLTAQSTKDLVFSEIDRWKRREKLKKVDVLVAIPPCQSISVINHKKKDEINRNSLVIESVEIVEQIRPKIFIVERRRIAHD